MARRRLTLDKLDHSSSEKKSFSSNLPFSRSKTEVKGSGGLRSKPRCLRSPRPRVAAEAIQVAVFFDQKLVQSSPDSNSPTLSGDGFDCNSFRYKRRSLTVPAHGRRTRRPRAIPFCSAKTSSRRK